MRGTMLWFNSEKGYGSIQAEDGERLRFLGADLAQATELATRCCGTPVEFQVVDGSERRAADIALVQEHPARRARRRSGSRISA